MKYTKQLTLILLSMSCSIFADSSNGLAPEVTDLNAKDVSYTLEKKIPYLEKAYATVYGSYAALSGGDIAEALGDLTGKPVLSIRVNHTLSEENGIRSGFPWESLLQHYDSGQLLACGWCGSDDEGDTHASWQGSRSTSLPMEIQSAQAGKIPC